MDDERLLTAVAEGDQTALREIFDRHAPWVAARLRRILPAEAVEDALQETFIAVWRGSARYTASGAAGAWIWGIARRQAALWARTNGRSAASLDSGFATAGGEDPATAATRHVDLEAALAALGPGGDKEREVVRMIYVEDRPLTEVAGLLGIPAGTVKSRLHRARRLLRATLEGGS